MHARSHARTSTPLIDLFGILKHFITSACPPQSHGNDKMHLFECAIANTLQGQGLISAAASASQEPQEATTKPRNPLDPLRDTPNPPNPLGDTPDPGSSPETLQDSAAPSTPPRSDARASRKRKRPSPRDIALVCLDMDGTLLDSNSKVCSFMILLMIQALVAGTQHQLDVCNRDHLSIVLGCDPRVFVLGV